jgi:hypothetical protein
VRAPRGDAACVASAALWAPSQHPTHCLHSALPALPRREHAAACPRAPASAVTAPCARSAPVAHALTLRRSRRSVSRVVFASCAAAAAAPRRALQRQERARQDVLLEGRRAGDRLRGRYAVGGTPSLSARARLFLAGAPYAARATPTAAPGAQWQCLRCAAALGRALRCAGVPLAGALTLSPPPRRTSARGRRRARLRWARRCGTWCRTRNPKRKARAPRTTPLLCTQSGGATLSSHI